MVILFNLEIAGVTRAIQVKYFVESSHDVIFLRNAGIWLGLGFFLVVFAILFEDVLPLAFRRVVGDDRGRRLQGFQFGTIIFWVLNLKG